MSHQRVETVIGDVQLPSLRRPRAEQVLDWVESHARWLLATMMVLEAALLLYMGRGLNFYYDEWDFVVHKYGGGLHSLLVAHVGNPVVFPVVVYKILFHLVGLNHYAVFRSVVIVLHLLAAGLVYVLAARRLSPVPALIAAALILFLGVAWEDLLWAFQIGYMLSIVGGLAAWVLLDREDRRGDLAATLALVVSALSSSLGIAIMIGVAVELAWKRQWRRTYLVLIPAALYLLWYLGYGESQVTKEHLINAPAFAEDLAAAAVGGLTGRGLDWGRPLALVLLVPLLWRLLRPPRLSPRLVGLLATALALWFVTAAARSTISPPETSRYIYLGAVAIVLIAAEMLPDVAISPRLAAFAAAFALYFAISGLTLLHTGANFLHGASRALSADLGALELAAPNVPPEYQPEPLLAPNIFVGPYLHTVRAIGSSPAPSAAEIAAAPAGTRIRVDEAVARFESGGMAPASPAAPVGALPRVTSAGGPAPAVVDGPRPGSRCWLTRATGAGAYTEFLLPARGIVVRARARPVQVIARRFAPPLYGAELAAVTPHAATLVRFPPDRATRPWLVRLASDTPSEVCGVP